MYCCCVCSQKIRSTKSGPNKCGAKNLGKMIFDTKNLGTKNIFGPKNVWVKKVKN